MHATMEMADWAATKNKKAAVMAEINKRGYIFNDSKTKITPRLFVKRIQGKHMLNCIVKKQKKKYYKTFLWC